MGLSKRIKHTELLRFHKQCEHEEPFFLSQLQLHQTRVPVQVQQNIKINYQCTPCFLHDDNEFKEMQILCEHA
jgi:hypothetical protein